MINKKTTGVPNVDRVTDDIYNHLNKMNSTPVVGLKGERGQTGIQGIPGVTGLQGETGVGFNYQLLAGNGLTGLPYDGTSNVTWSKNTVETFFDYSKKTICNWGTTTGGETGNYWIKVATITIDGAYSSGTLYAKIYGHREDLSFFTQEILVSPTNSGTGLHNTTYTSNLRTYQSTPSRNISVGKTFKDIKLVHVSGSGVSNNVVEVWLQLSYRSISSCLVEAYTKGNITLLTNRDVAYAAIPSTPIVTLDQNSFSYSENFAIGSSTGESGIALSVGGKATISDTPITSGTPQYVLVKDTGSNLVKTLPYTKGVLTPGKGLTGLQFDGTSNVTILKDNYDGYFDYLHRIIANWGTSGTPSQTTNKWVKVAQITLNGGYARASLYADIYGRGSGGQARAKQRVEVNVFNTATTFNGSDSTIHLDTETVSPKSSLDYQIALKDLKVVHRSGSGTTNNVIEVWLQYRSSSIDNLSAQVFYTNGFTVEKFRIAHQDAIDEGYIAIYDRNGYSYSESLALGTLNGASGMALAIGGQMSINTLPTATNPNTVLVTESGSDIVKSIPYFSYQGATGVQGQTGIIGNTGAKGTTGIVGVTGLRGLTGSQGVTGLRGLTGIQGIQGATGVGYNYTLSPGNGLTGLNYNGTSNVTWQKSLSEKYFTYLNKSICDWGTLSGYASNGKWVKAATLTVNGNWSSSFLYAKVYGSNVNRTFNLQDILVNITNSNTELSRTDYTAYINTNFSVINRLSGNSFAFRDIKLLHVSGSGVTNNVVEVWLQYQTDYTDQCIVDVYTKGTVSLLTNRDYYNENLPVDTLYIFSSNGAVHADVLTVGTSQGETGISLSVGGQASISNTPITSGTPQYVLVKDTGSNLVKTLPYYSYQGATGAQGVTGIQGQQGNQGPQGQQGVTGIGFNYTLTPGKGLTGAQYNGTSNVTWMRDTATPDLGAIYKKTVNWGVSSNPGTDKWIKVAEGLLNGSWSTLYLYADIYGSQSSYQGMCKQTLHIQIYNGSTDIDISRFIMLDTNTQRSPSMNNNYKAFKDLKVVRRSGSGVSNNVFEVWLQCAPSIINNIYAEVRHNNNINSIVTNRTSALDDITTGYVNIYSIESLPSHDRLLIGTEESVSPYSFIVKDAGSDILKSIPYFQDHLSTEKSLAIAAGEIGWYTIATCATGRAYGEFYVYDTDVGRHNFCKLQASTSYGINNLSCTQANRYSITTILNARILYLTADRTYGGAKLQVYVDRNCTLRVRQFLGKDINGWTGWDDVAPVKENISAWSEDTTTRIEDVTNPNFGLQANGAKVNNLYTKGNIYLRNKYDSAWLNFAVRDTAGSEALYDLSNIGDITLSGYLQHNAMTASRVTVWDSNKRLASSSILISEIGLLSGKNSVIDGSGTSNYIPSFSTSYRLTDSIMQSGPYSVSLRNSNWGWGSSFAALQIGNMALWANCNVVNGYGTYISNNRRHDGSTGNMALVNGGSTTYSQDGSAHEFYVNSGLTAGQAFTPTKVCSINAYSLDYYQSGGDGISIWGSQGYINTISATNGANSQLQLQAHGSSLRLQDGLILFAANMYCYNSLTVSENITAGIDMTVTQYLHSNYVRALDGSGMVSLSGYNASAAIIFINAFIGHQPYYINSGTQTINPRSGYIQLGYNTSSTYTLGTMPMEINTRVIIANISSASHTIVYNGTSSTLSSGSFREFIYNVYNNVGTWIAEW